MFTDAGFICVSHVTSQNSVFMNTIQISAALPAYGCEICQASYSPRSLIGRTHGAHFQGLRHCEFDLWL